MIHDSPNYISLFVPVLLTNSNSSLGMFLWHVECEQCVFSVQFRFFKILFLCGQWCLVYGFVVYLAEVIIKE